MSRTIRLVVYPESEWPSVGTIDSFAGLCGKVHPIDGWIGLAHSGPCFECMQLSGNRFAAAHMPMNPLYRGESEFHPVCKPNIFRKEWTETERLEMEILTNSPLVAAFFATTEYGGVEA